MAITKSPLRYPGGKTQLSEFLKNLIKINNLKNITYCEPFAGGFGAGLELLDSKTVDSVIINDYDIGIYSIWHAILFDLDNFINLIKNTPINIEQWKYQKKTYEKLKEKREYSIELAYSTFFLNRTNYSGIISGGPLGGYDQKSSTSIDARFNKKNLIKKLIEINKLKEKIQLYNLEANDLINDVLLERNQKQLFIFFDPPYYTQGKNLYTNFFKHDDHVLLYEHINLLNEYNWILTYDYKKEIKDIYIKYPTLEYRIHYSANRARKEKEYFIHNNMKVESYKSIKFE